MFIFTSLFSFIESYNHFAFETACSYNYVEIVEWLVELKPDVYFVETPDLYDFTNNMDDIRNLTVSILKMLRGS